MRAFLTGEKGFIARNLVKVAGDRIHWINSAFRSFVPRNDKGEIDFTKYIYLEEQLKKLSCDVIIHNGATVGTDVCGLYPKDAIINNVYGTYNIASLSKKLNIPVVYIGTTVIYDTMEYQNTYINEESKISPRTLYATTKYEGELIIRAYCQNSGYCILRPLFCYGGEGDMNSLIAKSIYNDIKGRKRPFKIFLDPTKIKDYMHVDDFCEAIVMAALSKSLLKGNDFNISADDPMPTWAIEQALKDIGIDTSYIEWVPETDYLGNHRVSNAKFKAATNNIWRPKISLVQGVDIVKESINTTNDLDYNPFQHLDKIEKHNINIETHYNFKG